MPNGQALQPNLQRQLVLTTLGRASLACVSDSGVTTELLGSGKPLGLLVYLACSPGCSASREHLVDLLWADQDVEAAKHSVRQALWFLRQRLGEAAISTGDGTVTLTSPLASDRDAFLEAIDTVEFERALELYRGDFLPGFAAPGGADFEQWADAERFRLRRLFRRAGEIVARDWMAKGRLRKAKDLAARLRDADPHDESGWRLVLETQLAANDRVGAELEAHRLEATLAQAERPPEPATDALLALVRQVPAESPATPSKATLTAELIGREREFAAILAAWDSPRHGSGKHVHVTGAAGLGKSRLLADVQARLRAGGARTVQVRANPGERSVPYTLASELAAHLAALPGAAAVSPASAGALVALNPSLSARYNAPADRAAELEALRRRETALVELLVAVADEQPVALLIDDVHWSDPDSRQLVEGLTTKLAGRRILVVTCARPGPEGEIASPATDCIALRPLSVQDTGALLGSLARLPPEPWAEGLPAALHTATHGSPLLMLETLHHLIERGTLILAEGAWTCAEPSVLGSELARGGALGRRIEDMERGQRWLLLLLATAGTPLATDLIVRAAARDREAVLDDLRALEVRGLATRDGAEWQPVHDEIATRVSELATPDALRAANSALGRQLAAKDRDDPDLLHRAARHFAAAGEERELARAFTRRMLLQRRRGERRRARTLAADLLGDDATPARVSHLVRALPLYVRLGLTGPGRIAALAGMVLAIGGVATAVLFHIAPPPPDIILVAIREDGDSPTAFTVPIRRDGWESGRTIEVNTLGRPYTPLTAVRSRNAQLVSSPDGAAWAFRRASGDSGDVDLFLAGAGGVRRLTFSSGDDYGPSWSPDGQKLAFATTRGNPDRYGHLAILDLATTQVTVLTHGEPGVGGPFWSPDGSRIAYEHAAMGSRRADARICVITVDGRTSRCLAMGDLRGWYDPNQLLVSVESSGTARVGRLNLRSGETVMLDRVWQGSQVFSSDGRWVACWCTRPGLSRPEWRVYPIDRPDLARRVDFASDSATRFALRWSSVRQVAPYLQRLELSAGSDSVVVGTEYQLAAQGFDPSGTPTALEALSWRSENPAVATVDESTGVLRARRLGAVTIRATAGGWRDAVRRIVVVPPTPVKTNLSEDWSGSIETQWVPFGDPRPQITDGPEGKRAFWNRGDGWFLSGAYSRGRFLAGRGLGFEAWLSTPVVGPRQQFVYLILGSNLDSAALAHWDHRTENPPLAGMSTRECGFRYPPGDGVSHPPRIAVADSFVVLPFRVNSGRWYRIRVQIFPDGRCGLALDGKPLALLRGALPTDERFWVVLQGNSLGNRMLVGPVTVWEGVSGGVDWSVLGDRP